MAEQEEERAWGQEEGMGPFRARQCECGFAHALQQREEEGEGEKATSWVARYISQRAEAKGLSLVAEKAP